MASNQDQASYKAGETKGRTEEKTGNMIDTAKEKAFEVKDRAGGFLGEKTEAAKQKTSETTQSTKESTEAGKEKPGPGILQQAGEQVKNVAFGAKDAVVNTLGMGGENKSNEKGEKN